MKKCPLHVYFRHNDPWESNFEDGCGGYGYNLTYIGSRIWQNYTKENFRKTTRDYEVSRPVDTLMFADTAMTELDDNDRPYYLEYSFVQPRYFVSNGKVDPAIDPSPSIHFRHRDQANIGWVDGHISSRRRGEFDKKNAYRAL